MDLRPREVIVEIGAEASAAFRNLRNSLPDVPFSFVEDSRDFLSSLKASKNPFGGVKGPLYLTRHKGEFLKMCPGSEGQVCCNFFVVNFASNCPMDCSYCYLQDYLAWNLALKVFSNTEDLIEETHGFLSCHRKSFFRVGTGELTDSLALDPYIGLSDQLVPFFAEQPNALLELKTKSDHIERLLPLDPRGRVVVSWSMNPQRVIDSEEHGTASLDDRLGAAYRCQEAGYKLGFHFDPIIEYPGWEQDYQELVERIFSVVDHRRTSWISMGVLRYTPGLKRVMRQRFPRTQILSGEQVLCADGKFRYFQPLRVSIYRKMLQWIREASPTVFVYLCMESREVWEQVFGFSPGCAKDLADQINFQQ